MGEIAEYLSDIRELVRDKINRYFQGEDDLEKLVDSVSLFAFVICLLVACIE